MLEAALASTSQDGLNQAELGTVGAASLMPPQYVDFKEQIRTEMFTIKQKMNELRSSHGKATLTSFDDTNSQEVEIEVLTQDITRLFRKCEVRLTKFGETGAASEADEKVNHSPGRLMPTALLLELLDITRGQLMMMLDGCWCHVLGIPVYVPLLGSMSVALLLCSCSGLS